MTVLKENINVKGSDLVKALVGAGLLPSQYEDGEVVKIESGYYSITEGRNYRLVVEKEVNLDDVTPKYDTLIIKDAGGNEVLKADMNGKVKVSGGIFSGNIEFTKVPQKVDN